MLERTIAALRREGGLYPLSALAVIFAALIVAGAYWRLIRPTEFVVAVAPPRGAEADLLHAFSSMLRTGQRGVRIDVRAYESLQDASLALEGGAADIAVVRPDISLPANGLTVAILRQEALLIVHPANQKLESVSALAGKTLAVIARDEADVAAVRTLLDFHDVAPAVRIEAIPEAEIATAVAGGRVAAAAFVATPGDPEARRVARALARAFGKPMKLLPIGQAEAFSAANPTFSALKTPAGGVLANPVLPAEETDGAGVSWRLMARSGLDRGPISTLTERLFENRSALAKSSRVALSMKAPGSDDATSAVLPNHRGALDYFNREQLTFMDRYGDWLWFGLFAATGVSSAFAWIGRMFTRRRREAVDDALDRLCRILGEARHAQSREALAAISSEIDRLIAICVRRARRRTTSTRTMGALMLAIEAARAAVRDRREELAASADAPEAANPALSSGAKSASAPQR